MPIIKLSFLFLFFLFSPQNSNAAPHDHDPVKNFSEKGIIVKTSSFFEKAQSKIDNHQDNGDNVIHLSLVTSSGVYAFLETPQNQEYLKDIAPGAFVNISGKLLKTGSLLHIESLEKIDNIPSFDVDKFKKASGQSVTLSGKNKCQCGLKVATLPSSCSLGHLHHLETKEGIIYNYLLNQKAVDLFQGNGSHFEKIQIEALQFPGQYLLVKSVEIK